ncbi:MAG: mscL [Aeromicrobium sp.]|jgi:large conductance mechanosensitive channel|nr:mscL [Aeromicrobium sp.]
MIKGFKDFLMRGNVVDLAVGIAIGVAFTTLVGAFGNNFVKPIVASIGGGGADSKGFGFHIRDSAATFVDIGGIINALIVFVVTMAVIYFAIVVPVQKLQSLRKPGDPEPEAVPEDIALLREIRDSLQRRA